MNARSILITGCSSGIGYDAAHALQAQGWQVFATCRRQEDCARLTGEGLTSFRLDLRDAASIRAALDSALAATGGRLDALFNNGAFGLPGAAEDLPTDALREIFETNFFGWHELTRAVIPVMRAQGHGRIVQNSSVLGLVGMRWRAAYVATKFALEGYSDTLRIELAEAGIHVILIEPGPITTDIRIKSRPHFERWVDWRASPHRARYEESLLKRLYAENPGRDAFELPPSAVTARLVRALTARRPKPRYYVTTPTHIAGIARRLLSSRMQDRILGKS